MDTSEPDALPVSRSNASTQDAKRTPAVPFEATGKSEQSATVQQLEQLKEEVDDKLQQMSDRITDLEVGGEGHRDSNATSNRDSASLSLPVGVKSALQRASSPKERTKSVHIGTDDVDAVTQSAPVSVKFAVGSEAAESRSLKDLMSPVSSVSRASRLGSVESKLIIPRHSDVFLRKEGCSSARSSVASRLSAHRFPLCASTPAYPASRRSKASDASSEFDTWDPKESDDGSEISGDKHQSHMHSHVARGGTVFAQDKIAADVPMALRCLGVALGFITVVFLWEATDLAMTHFLPTPTKRLICYFVLSVSAVICLMLSYEWVRVAEHTLVPSFAYALSTLFLAIGSWGALFVAVGILLPRRTHLAWWSVGGAFTLLGTVIYGAQTKHNVILDIASCATTLGLEELDDPESYQPIFFNQISPRSERSRTHTAYSTLT
jgi:hypothetical protein